MKITLELGEMFIIPLVLRIRGIINISPNTRAIFHEHFSNRIFVCINQSTRIVPIYTIYSNHDVGII